MARILDKDTRVIDIDFGMINTNLLRDPNDATPTSVSHTLLGANQLLNALPAGTARGGSFIQYSRVDLSMMTKNNEVMQPINVSVQRNSSVPFGGMNNGNDYDLIEEYIWVLTRPLNNTDIAAGTTYNDIYRPLRSLGLDGTEGYPSGSLGGLGAGWPNQEQTIYAEQRLYATDFGTAATQTNGAIDPGTPIGAQFNSVVGMPKLQSQNTWGSMNAITGPNLHVYRMVIIPSQDFSFVDGVYTNQALEGSGNFKMPAVNIAFLCKDPSYTEGEYLTTLANVMNSTPEGGSTA